VDVVQLLRALRGRNSTGMLTLESARSGRRTLYFLNGDIVAATTDVEDLRLGRFLYRSGHIDRAQLDAALQAATVDHPLGEILVEKGFVTAELRQEALTGHFREILFSSFLLREGTFHFTSQDAIFADNLQLFFDTDELIAEGVRLVEEIAILSRELEREEHIYQRVGLRPALPLRKEQEELFRHIDGRRSTAELFVLSPLERLPTIQLLSQLLEQGLIRKIGSSPRLSPEELPTYPLLPEEVYQPAGTSLEELLPEALEGAHATGAQMPEELREPAASPVAQRKPDPDEGVFTSSQSVLDVVDLSHIRQYGVATDIPLDGIVEAAAAEDDEHHMAGLEVGEDYEHGDDLEHGDGEEHDDDLEHGDGGEHDDDLEHCDDHDVHLEMHDDDEHDERAPQLEAHDDDDVEDGSQDDDSVGGLEAALEHSLEEDFGDDSEPGLDALHAGGEEGTDPDEAGLDDSWGPAESLLDADALDDPDDLHGGLDLEDEDGDEEPLPPTAMVDDADEMSGVDEDFEELRPEDVAGLHPPEEEPLSLEEALFPPQAPLYEPPPARAEDDTDGGDEDIQELSGDAVLEPGEEPDDLDEALGETVSIRATDPILPRVIREEPLLETPVNLKAMPTVKPALPPEDEISQEDMAVLEKIVAIFQPRVDDAPSSPGGRRKGRAAAADNARTGSSQLSNRQRALLRERAEIYNQIFTIVFNQFSRKLGREKTRQRFQDFFTPGNSTYPELFIDLAFKADGTIDPDLILRNLDAYPTQRPAEVFDASLNELFYFLLRDIHQILDPGEQAHMMESIVQVRSLLFKKSVLSR
jgi:hypothetical protein